jgi:hypothetical protein
MPPATNPVANVIKLSLVKTRVKMKSSSHFEQLAYKRLKERMMGQTSSKPDTAEETTIADKTEDSVVRDCLPEVIFFIEKANYAKSLTW